MLSRSRKAFTLLELIVVIVILGILAALAIPTFAQVIEKARQSTAVSAAESVGRDAIALAAFDDGETSDAGLVDITDIRTAASETGTDPDVTTDDKVQLDEAAALTDGAVTVSVGDVDVVLTFVGNTVSGEAV